MADKTIAAKSVLTVNLNSVFKQLHDIALAAAEKVDKNYGIVNTLFDNKTGGMRGGGEFLIMTVGNDVAKEKGIDGSTCAKVLQTYVEKFAGPDAAKKVSANSISEIQGNDEQAEQEEKAEEEKEAGEESNKDDDIEERGDGEEQQQDANESKKPKYSKSSLLKLLFEADPSAGKDEDPDGPDQEDIDQQNAQTDAAGEEVEAADKDKEEDEEKAKEEKDAKDSEHKDNEKRGINGYSVPYRVNIETVKVKEFKFDDSLEEIGNDIKNGVIGKALAWIWNDLKKSHIVLPGGNLKIGAALKVVDAAVDAIYQTIDAAKIDGDFKTNMRKKFPNANVDCRVFRNNEILKTLQNQNKLTPTMQSKINKAKLALVVKVTRDDPSFEKYDEKLIADIFNKSIDKHLISKLKISPKDVIRAENATDNFKDKTIYDNPKSDKNVNFTAAGAAPSKTKKESLQSFYEYFLITEAMLTEDDVDPKASDQNPDSDKVKKKEANEADKSKVSEIQTFIYQEAKKELGDDVVETKFAPADEVIKYLQSKGMNDNKIIHDLQEHAYSMYIDVVEKETSPEDSENRDDGEEKKGEEEKKPVEPDDEENKGDRLEDRDDEEEQLGTGESYKPKKSKLMKLIFEDVIDWKKAASDDNNGSIAQKIEKLFENLIYKFIQKGKDPDVPVPFVITYDTAGNVKKESIQSKEHLLSLLFEDLSGRSLVLEGHSEEQLNVEKEIERIGAENLSKNVDELRKNYLDHLRKVKDANKDNKYVQKIEVNSKNWISKEFIGKLRDQDKADAETIKKMLKDCVRRVGKTNDVKFELQALVDAMKNLPDGPKKEPEDNDEKIKITFKDIKDPSQLEDLESPNDDDKKKYEQIGDPLELIPGEDVKIPDVQNKGKYEFMGFQPDPEDMDESGDTYAIYTKGGKDTVKITFFDADPESGEKTGEPLGEIEVEEGTPINSSEEAQEKIAEWNKKLGDDKKEGYIYKGWDPDVTNEAKEDMEIVAKYIAEDKKDEEFTVMFQYAPDQEKPDNVDPVQVDGKDEVKVKAGEKVTPPEAPEIEGYKFKEWDTDGISLDNVTEDIMALAKYQKIIKIIVKVPKNPEKPEDTEEVGDPIDFDPEKPLKEQLPEPPTFDGWEHEGWDPDPDSIKDPAEDIEITATYKKGEEEEKESPEEKKETPKTKGRIYVIPDTNNLSGADPEKDSDGEGDEDQGEVVNTDLFIIPHPKMKFRDEKNQIFKGDNKSGIAS